jgi:hypothetical protein
VHTKSSDIFFQEKYTTAIAESKNALIGMHRMENMKKENSI